MIVSAGSKYARHQRGVHAPGELAFGRGDGDAERTGAAGGRRAAPARRVTEATNLSSGKLPAPRGPVNPVAALGDRSVDLCGTPD